MRNSWLDAYHGRGGRNRGDLRFVKKRKTHPGMFFFGIFLGVATFVLLPASGLGFSMRLPVDCSEAQTCFTQNYFDHDASERYADYLCGFLSYNGHTGTDIRVSYADMERGVPVLAVADGVVRAVRDGEPEGEISVRGMASVRKREAGNGVVVVHDGGYETQYSHLRQGSVAVRPGQFVRAGQRLGLIGLSGVTEFPHLEISVRDEGRFVDPFTGDCPGGCDARRQPLWSGLARESSVLSYQPSGLLEAGFFDAPPKDSIALLRREGWIEGRADPSTVLVFGVQAFGPQTGDVWIVRLTGPDNQVLAESRKTQERNQAQAMRYVGKKRGAAWIPGRYRGEFRLTRSGKDVISVVREIDIP